jgi:hypothetical protein
LSSITQDATKFYYVISHLENKYAAEVEDVITNPPPTGHYEKIKAELIRHLSLSEEQRICQLLMHEEMGDRRPTQFLRHLRILAGPSVLSDFLCTLWTNRLLPNIQDIIATQGQAALDDVAQLADKIAVTGEFFASSPAECTDVTDFGSRLRIHIGKLRPLPASRHAAPSTFIFKDLATASHLSMAWCPPGSLPSPVCRPIEGPPQGR